MLLNFSSPSLFPAFMSYTPNQQDGHFVWHDLMSTNKDEALSFYLSLFSWEDKSMYMGPEVGDYTMFLVNQKEIGGIVPLNPEHNIPSHWISYISVHDIEKACIAMKSDGATLHRGPFEIPDVGQMAVVEDPTGAYFSPYQDKTDLDIDSLTVSGGFVWHELMTRDVQSASAFYSGITGWTKLEMPLPDGQIYGVFSKGELQAAGIVAMPPDAQGPSNWLPYIGVEEVEETAHRAQAMGGKIWVPPTRIEEPANVHFSVLSAPDGSMFGILGP